MKIKKNQFISLFILFLIIGIISFASMQQYFSEKVKISRNLRISQINIEYPQLINIELSVNYDSDMLIEFNGKLTLNNIQQNVSIKFSEDSYIISYNCSNELIKSLGIYSYNIQINGQLLVKNIFSQNIENYNLIEPLSSYIISECTMKNSNNNIELEPNIQLQSIYNIHNINSTLSCDVFIDISEMESIIYDISEGKHFITTLNFSYSYNTFILKSDWYLSTNIEEYGYAIKYRVDNYNNDTQEYFKPILLLENIKINVNNNFILVFPNQEMFII